MRAPGLTWHGIPVVLPRRGDPRLRVSAVIMSLQVLGQVALDFKVSIAQIFVTIGTCAIVEIAIGYRQKRMLMWPASALLTGNGVAFILRASGTRHGDWWSLHGIHWFLLAALVGLLSKYVLKTGDRHFYNPSNFGLIAVLLIVGTPWVFPQYLYWGPLDPPVLIALALILGGVVWTLRPIGMLPMAAAFLAPFFVLVGVLAATGSCFLAVWHTGPVCGTSYWTDICLSPEVLIFVFYMMSDPRTAPQTRAARMVYGALTAVVAALLIAPQETEYGTKIALLGALTVVCSIVPVLERLVRDRRLTVRGPLTPTVAAVALIAVSVPAAAASLAGDRNLLDLERGVSRTGGPVQ
jgi:Na+-transporting NADH:ubiquinone oxidoreductase subunit NqrB